MKYYYMSIVILISIFCNSFLYSQEMGESDNQSNSVVKETMDNPKNNENLPSENNENEEENIQSNKQSDSEDVSNGEKSSTAFCKYNIGERIFSGFTYPGGVISGVGEQERLFSYMFGLSFTFEYRYNEKHSATTEISYSKRNYSVKKSLYGKDAFLDYNFKFLELYAGYRFNYKSFYAGCGFFTGYPTGGLIYNDNSSEDTILKAEKDSIGMDFGLYIDLGYRYELNDNFDLSAGIKYDFGVISYYNDSDELMTNSGYIYLECSYKLIGLL